MLKTMWKHVNSTVQQKPWTMIFISALSSGAIVLLSSPYMTLQIISLLLFPFSAGSFAAITTWGLNKIKERENLHFNFPDGGSIFFPCQDDDIYPAPYRVAIWIRITNLSPMPISIVQIDLDIPRYRKLISPIHINPLESYTVASSAKDSSCTQKILVKENLLKPILSLSAYQGLEGYLFFAMCPRIHENNIISKLTITTTRGVKNLSVKISRASYNEPEFTKSELYIDEVF